MAALQPNTPLVVSDLLHLTAQDEPLKALDFNAIFRAEFDYVWNSLRRLGVPERDLEDLTHDVFFRIYERLADYDAARPVRPWLFGFSFRVASDYRRRFSNRRELLSRASETSDPAPTALDRLVQVEAMNLAQAALEGIEIERRAVFILHEIDGSSVPEIAAALGLPLNTTYSRLRVAREEFRTALRREQLRRGER
jgi:RNA polymerase sigma-70 factor (ECF subfamily)